MAARAAVISARVQIVDIETIPVAPVLEKAA